MAEIQPALTPEQWRYVQNLPDSGARYGAKETWVRWGIDSEGARWCELGQEYPIELDRIPSEIAALNDALPDENPYKFTREDVRVLRGAADAFRVAHDEFHPDAAWYGCTCVADAKHAAALADRITALLPPEP